MANRVPNVGSQKGQEDRLDNLIPGIVHCARASGRRPGAGNTADRLGLGDRLYDCGMATVLWKWPSASPAKLAQLDVTSLGGKKIYLLPADIRGKLKPSDAHFCFGFGAGRGNDHVGPGFIRLGAIYAFCRAPPGTGYSPAARFVRRR